MAYDLTPQASVSYSTTGQLYGTACFPAGAIANVSGVLPTNKIFRVRVSGKTTYTGTQVIISQGSAFWMGQKNGFAFAEVGSGSPVSLQSSVVVDDGAYHSFDLWVNESGCWLYVDGVLAASSTTGATAAGVNVVASPLVVGALGGSFIWNSGFIDEAAVSSVIPSAGSYTPAAISNSEADLIAVWHLDSNLTNTAGTGATATTLTGPTSGTVSVASTNFTVGANGAITGTVVVTPNDSSGGGTFTPTSVSISSGSPTGTFTYTPGSTGAKTIGTTNNGSLTNPATITYTSNSAAATATTLTGPTTGVTGVASTNFTVGANGTITGTVVVTPSDAGAGGTFTPTTVSISSGSPTGTFTYTPSSAGAKVISTTNNGSLTNPSTITYTATLAAATAVTMTGPTAGATNVASTNFTIGANGPITGTVVVTPSSNGGGGTFSPTTVSISSGTPTATFTYTPTTAGAKTISVTNNGSLTNPSNITYTATAGALYTRVDTTDALTGQNIMVLVPSTGASVPYNAANPTKVVLHSHGMSETETAILGSDKVACTNALLDAGYIVAGSNCHGSNWGGSGAPDDLGALDKYVRANYNVVGVGIWSQSMGGNAGLLAIAQNKVKGVVGWLGTYASCNLANIYSIGTYAGYIDSAYGITGTGNATYANKTYCSDPVLMPATAFRHIPMRFYASSSDGIVPKAQHSDLLSTLVAGTTRESTVVACTGAHGDASHFQPSDYLAFFERCFTSQVATVGQLVGSTPSLTTRAVTLTLKLDASTLAASLTGLKVSFWDEASPELTTAARYQSAVETTDASGVLTFSVGSTLASTGTGYIDVRGVGLHYCGPVVVT